MTKFDKKKMLCSSCKCGFQENGEWECKEELPRKDYVRTVWGRGDTAGCSHWEASIYYRMATLIDTDMLKDDLKQAYEQLTIVQTKCTELELEKRELAEKLKNQQDSRPHVSIWSMISFMRPVVVAFGIEMERRLRANDHKGGWEKCTYEFLLAKLFEECGEVGVLINDKDSSSYRMLEEAADAANVLMMIADNSCSCILYLNDTTSLEMLLSKLIEVCGKSTDGYVRRAVENLTKEIEKHQS